MRPFDLAPRFAIRVLVAILVAGCGVSPNASVEQGTADSNALTLSSRVMPGAEAHRCQLFSMPNAPYLVGFRHESTRGSHHVVLHRTTLPSIPASLREPFDCNSPASKSLAVGGVLYSAQTSTGSLTLPAGVGLPIVAGAVVLLESHAMNPSSVPLDVAVQLELMTSVEANVHTHAGVLDLSAPFIHVAPRSRAEASLACPLGADITLLTAVGSMSQRGAEFRAFEDKTDAVAAAPFYTSGDHPTTLAKNTRLTAGSQLRIRCTYNAIQETQDRFQGPGSEDEHCAFSALYYPTSARVDEQCVSAADRFGTGESSCAAALACADTCPPSANDGTPRVDPCIQRCVASSCPSAGRTLVAALACRSGSCAPLRDACIVHTCR